MNKEIKYNGLSTVPPDNTCQDGDSAMLLNLIPEDSALKPMSAPKMVFNLGENHSVVYVHKATTYTHYIIINTANKKLLWTIDGSNFTDLYSIGDKELYQVVGVGNTLIVLTDAGMFYFLWKGDTSGYLFLGNDIPELPISFGLQGEMQRTDEFTLEFDNLNWETKTKGDGGSYVSYNEFSDENKKKITSQVLAKVNKFIADRSTNKGKFIFPFLVRYAYRLYDGNLIRHSAPVLMVCSTSCAPIVMWRHLYGKNGLNRADVRVVGMLHSLDYAVIKQSDLDLLKDWTDIVKSVDIFISKPIYTYDQNGECDKFFNYDEYGDDTWGYSICKHINQAADKTKYPLRYQKKDMGYLYQMTFDKDNLGTRPGGILGLPRKDTSTVKENIRNCSNFYFLESIKIEQLTTTRTLLNIEEDYLQSLVNREVMTDDYDSHDKIIPKYAFEYNSRINITSIRKKLFEGFNAGAMMPFTDGYIKHWSNAESTMSDRKISISVYVYIKQDGKDIVVNGTAGVFGVNNPVLFIYYPNANAYKAVVNSWDYFGTFYEVPLERHAFLNGSFYYGGWNDLEEKVNNLPSVSTDVERTVEKPNKIYTSEVNNPFYFPVTGINTVGTGRILGIATAAKALSQGQFGQFPLYAFTDEGVWALEVNSTGGYSAKQPITRDVCLSSKSITQIDSAVLFTTDRGIMLLQGSQTMCISDILNGENAVSVTMLPKIDKILEHADLSKGTLRILPFMDFVRDCRMIYDYEHQRIIAYNNSKEHNCNYAYIFSLKSKQWGMMQSNIADNVNSYPDALAVLNDGSLVNFSDKADEVYKSIVVSRPIKLDAYDIHKSVDTIIQRGVFKKGHVKSILYASNDLYNWVPVWSSIDHYLRGFRGTPYKYIRIVLLANLSNDEGITGCSVQFTPRFTNQPR
ncbi:hypothetical protein J5A56_00585 [Prevotella melaninogenica]|uniref:hypothetical protein n=1 Tax=Prevotella TaxID=838 RepID=UPI0003ACE83A|nr:MULTISPECIES: hypothetical protein [Prevotella]ERJ80058.1 hypothetical protein HMPREF9148_00144 [Prevotella sp. F0091]QUB72932.1 hypothetical protein J5A56_00585 [Prevotella melaninogenica]